MSVPPWLLLALLAALAMALAYQLVSGRLGWRVMIYWTLILAGLLTAEVLAEEAGWNVTRFGDLRVLPDLAGGTAMMLCLWFLGL